jgi:hypothetical protein
MAWSVPVQHEGGECHPDPAVNNLIAAFTDVTLKEPRKLVLVAQAPLSKSFGEHALSARWYRDLPADGGLYSRPPLSTRCRLRGRPVIINGIEHSLSTAKAVDPRGTAADGSRADLATRSC